MKPRDEKRYSRPVGERFVYEGETVEVVGYDRNKEGCACRDCVRFGNCSYNEMTGSCRWYEREDGTDVIFRKVEQARKITPHPRTKVVINSGFAMNHFISIQAAADEYGISTRWIWKSIRVDRTLGAVVRNGRIYLRRIEWEAFVERHPRLIEEWHDLHAHLQYRYIGQ